MLTNLIPVSCSLSCKASDLEPRSPKPRRKLSQPSPVLKLQPNNNHLEASASLRAGKPLPDGSGSSSGRKSFVATCVRMLVPVQLCNSKSCRCDHKKLVALHQGSSLQVGRQWGEGLQIQAQSTPIHNDLGRELWAEVKASGWDSGGVGQILPTPRAGLLNKRFWASLCNPVCDWAGLLLLLIRLKKSISGSDAGLAEVERRSSRGRAGVEQGSRSSRGRAEVEQRSSRGRAQVEHRSSTGRAKVEQRSTKRELVKFVATIGSCVAGGCFRGPAPWKLDCCSLCMVLRYFNQKSRC